MSAEQDPTAMYFLNITALILLCACSFTEIQAQIELPTSGCNIRYQYDASGNRIERDWYCYGGDIRAKSNTTLDSNEVTNSRLTEVYMNVFPNPTSDLLNVQFTENMDAGHLEIFDAVGRSLLQQQGAGNSVVVDVSDLQAGTYYITFTLYHFALQIHPKMRRYFPRRRDETFAGRSEEVVA